MAKTNIRGSQIADGANGVDLAVDVTGVLPVGNGGNGVANPTAGRFMVGNGTSVIDLSKLVPTGAVVGTTDTQTLTAKTLTAPKIDQINDSVNGLKSVEVSAAALAVDYVRLIGGIAGTPGTVSVGAGGTDTNVHLNLFSKGSGAVLLNGVQSVDLSSVQTVTNKVLSTGTKVGAATTDISGAWTAWTPALVGITLGTGTLSCRYMQIGKTVHFEFKLVFGSTTTFAAAGPNGFALPAAVFGTSTTASRWRFQGLLWRTAGFDEWIMGRVVPTTSLTNVELVFRSNAALGDNFITSTNPQASATGDGVDIQGTYEAA